VTLLPIDDRNVHGFEGPEYQMSRICARPFCEQNGSEVHHIWRRSHLGAPFNWVVLPDGSACGNLIRLCNPHHRLVTENEAKISFEAGSFYWVQDGMELMPLDFQPPWVVQEYEHTRSVDDLIAEVEFETPGEKTGPVLDNECPTCHQPLPKPKIADKTDKREAKRLRRTWSVTVPADRREDGAEVLDTLVEEARVLLARAGPHYEAGLTTRYYILAMALGLFVTHGEQIVADE